MLSPKKVKRIFSKCHELAKDSPDPNTKVGSQLVHMGTMSSVSEGFNGFGRGVSDENMPLTRPEKYRPMIHSEVNLVLNAFRTGAVKYSPSEYGLFCTLSPCEDCARLLYQSGITSVYVESLHETFQTYRVGTDYEDPAPDIVGTVECIVIDKKFGGMYRIQPVDIHENHEIQYYHIEIKPRNYNEHIL